MLHGHRCWSASPGECPKTCDKAGSKSKKLQNFMKIDWGFSIYQVLTIGVPEETWSKLRNYICTHLYHVNQMPLQRDTNTSTRGHSMKLRKERCLKRQQRNFFRHRVVNCWNMLTDNIVTSPSVNIFKNRLDAFHRARHWLCARWPACIF